MAIALGAQAINATPATSATSHSASLTAVNGDLLVVCIGIRDDVAIDTVTGAINTFTIAGSVTREASSGHRAAIYYCENATGGSETVTVTFAGGASARAYLNISRWTGAATSSALDKTNGSANTSAASHASGAITAAGAGVAICAAKQSGAPTETDTAGYTALTQAVGGREYFAYLLNSAGSTECTWSVTPNVAAAVRIANFLEPSSSSVYGSVIGGKLTGRGVLTGGSLI